MTIAAIVGLVGVAFLLAISLRVLLLAMRGVRLTDWMGFVAATGVVITATPYLIYAFGGLGWLAVVLSIPVAIVWANESLRAHRGAPQRELLGAFVVGRPQPGVRNWASRR